MKVSAFSECFLVFFLLFFKQRYLLFTEPIMPLDPGFESAVEKIADAFIENQPSRAQFFAELLIRFYGRFSQIYFFFARVCLCICMCLSALLTVCM